MATERGVIRFWPDPFLKAEANRGTQQLTKLHHDFWTNGQVYPNDKKLCLIFQINCQFTPTVKRV
jgi:hypothetical protein